MLVMLSICALAQGTDTLYLPPIEVTAVRASEETPVAKTNISRQVIARNNAGQDLPFILNSTPSVIVNSDAGNGIGYTGIRIRGTDASRINVTLNGIPYNDAESQGTFFVDLPDIASSASNLQVQRGVGTSTNGSGSFGGTINISTNEIIQKRNFEFNNSFGSYHSFKNTIVFNSGIFKKHFTIDARLSNIRSDGYIERAASRLKSFFTSAAYADQNNSFRINIFSGKEKTYQSWYGINENMLSTNRRYNPAGTEKPGEPYANETDNYTQTHYQAFYNHKFNKSWKFNLALFLTKGKGYYEQYKSAQLLADYGLPDYFIDTTIIKETDLIRRLWLSNDFYGNIFSLHYTHSKRNFQLGGSINKYDGNHFGQIISATIQPAVPVNFKWYDLDAVKKEFSIYGKWTEKISPQWQTYIDLQSRSVSYNINGFRNNPGIEKNNNYFFFNPKAGIIYYKNKNRIYLSYAHASKEPNRDDFESGSTNPPQPEKLHDIEAGFEKQFRKSRMEINLYYMLYRNQLVLTGKINDVGAYTRTNIKNSYRTGIELQGNATLTKWISLAGNITFSANKIKGFTEYTDDYDNGIQQQNSYALSDLAFSPAIISSVSATVIPIKNVDLVFTSKYVSRQYLDNTSNLSRSLSPYYVQDARINYTVDMKKTGKLNLFFQANNIFSNKYEANGYTFSYYSGNKLTTENYYFPMAPLHIWLGVNVQLN